MRADNGLILDPITFAAGVYLLTDEQDDELAFMLMRPGPVTESLLREASAYILRVVDRASLEQIIAKLRSGEIPMPPSFEGLEGILNAVNN